MNILTNKNNSKEYILINILTNKILLLDSNNNPYETTLISIAGVDLLGNRKILGVTYLKEDTNRCYLDIMEEIKGQGIENIYFIACEFNDRLRRAIKISYPYAICIDNFTLTLVNLWKYTPIKGRNNLKKIIRELYICKSYEEAKINIDNLKEQFSNNKLLIILYKKYFSNIEDYYKYNQYLREFLFSESFFITISDKVRLSNKNNNVMSYNEFIQLIKPIFVEIENTNHYNSNKWIDIIDGATDIFPEIAQKIGDLI